MNPNQGREAAYVSSKVKDLSLISNTPDFVGLFACITPKAHPSLESRENKIDTDNDGIPDTYLPQLVRDVDTLDTLFGDPRIDPATYKDLYTVRYIVQSGFACYIAKVKSGNPYSATISLNSLFATETPTDLPINPQFDTTETNPEHAHISQELRNEIENLDILFAKSSVTGLNEVVVSLIPIKPYSLNQVAFEITFNTKATKASETIQVASARIMLTPDTKNSDFITVLNAYLGGELSLSLPDALDDTNFATVEEADQFIEGDYFCIVNLLLSICGLYRLKEEGGSIVSDKFFLKNMTLVSDGNGGTGLSIMTPWPSCYSAEATKGLTFHCLVTNTEESELKVSQADYVTSLSLYKDPRFYGVFISELSADVTHDVTTTVNRDVYTLEYELYTGEMSGDDPKEEGTYYINVGTESKPNYEERTAENKYRTAYQRTGSAPDYIYTEVPITELDPQLNPIYTLEYELYTGELDPEGTYYVNLGTSEEPDWQVRTEENATKTITIQVLDEMTSDERRGLHYIIKNVASLRKDLTCIFSTPYSPHDDGYDKNPVLFDLDRACNWVAARGDYSDLWEYGNSQALDYSEQAFYCEMYWSWLKWNVIKLVNGMATGSTSVVVAPAAFVILRGLASYRSRGSWYPVAGDQGGILPDACIVLQNPSTKSQRDKLISYRINPIYDTGLRGVQIYGNDTLNPQYTDLSAAHIARTMVYIRSQVDTYTETIKFSLNTPLTWGSWINYVTTRILEPIRALNGLQWYSVDMGYNTTTRDEIAQRKIKGVVSLQFTQALEIVTLDFVVNSSALVMEE